MTTMTDSGPETHASSFLVTAGMVVLGWGVAALLVSLVPHGLPSVAVRSLVQAVVILAAAFAFMRVRPDTCLDHALLVGVSWLLLSIGAELVVAAQLHHGWYELLGSPVTPGLRGVQFVAWLVGPALFARVGEDVW